MSAPAWGRLDPAELTPIDLLDAAIDALHRGERIEYRVSEPDPKTGERSFVLVVGDRGGWSPAGYPSNWGDVRTASGRRLLWLDELDADGAPVAIDVDTALPAVLA